MAALLLAKRVIEDARGAEAASDRSEAERIQAAIGAHYLFLEWFVLNLNLVLSWFSFSVQCYFLLKLLA